MKLSKRLEAVASFVWDQGRILDVGSNHGYLCVYFALQHRKTDIIATDCNSKSLWEAEKNFRRFHVEDQIKCVVTDGLSGIELEKEDQIIISGMGTTTMLHILTPDVLEKGNHFILQSNNHLFLLRSYMVKHGFNIQHEKVVFERQKYYVIIDFVRGEEAYTEEQLRYGPCLLKQSEVDYFKYLYNKKETQYHRMMKSEKNTSKSVKSELIQLKKIRENL